MTLIELQSHSTHSDGQLAPAEVVAEAARAGVTTLALSDHDSVAGVGEAMAAGEELGVEIVPAVEMSCVHEYAEDLHICGYWVDLEKIEPACERAQRERRERAGEIVENLRGFGFELTLEDAIREAGGADSIGRPHIAKAAGATGDLGPFFEEYLVPGAKAFVPRRWPDAAEAISLIHEAGRLLRLPRADPQDLRPLRRLRHLRPRRAAGAAAPPALSAFAVLSAIRRFLRTHPGGGSYSQPWSSPHQWPKEPHIARWTVWARFAAPSRLGWIQVS
jgi:predicted metal-dependent phosphoesterase TrpH